MNEEYRQKLSQYVADFRLPRYRELPDFGLHLEQVTRYTARYVPGPLTGSMVSNYVKQKLIPGPSKKSYSRDSIAYLIFLSYIKAVMPLENIGLMMEIQKSSYDLQVAYDYFCDELEICCNTSAACGKPPPGLAPPIPRKRSCCAPPCCPSPIRST